MFLNLVPQTGVKGIGLSKDLWNSVRRTRAEFANKFCTPWADSSQVMLDSYWHLTPHLLANPGVTRVDFTWPIGKCNLTNRDQTVSSGRMTQDAVLSMMVPFKGRPFTDFSICDVKGGTAYPRLLLSHDQLLSLHVDQAGWNMSFFNEITIRMTKLTRLYLSNMKLRAIGDTGLDSLTKLASLKSLQLKHLGAVGNVSLDKIHELTRLTNLNIERLGEECSQGATGAACSASVNSFPKNLRKLSHLRLLQLSHNNIIGPLPNETWDFPSVKNINFDGNSISGPLHDGIFAMGRLPMARLEMTMTANNLEGELPMIPSGFVSLNFDWNSLTKLHPRLFLNTLQLIALHLQGNKIQGPLPTEGICNNAHLCSIDIRGNYFRGALPGEFGVGDCGKYLMRLRFSDNNFSGAVPPSWKNLSRIKCMELCDNNFLELNTATPPFQSIYMPREGWQDKDGCTLDDADKGFCNTSGKICRFGNCAITSLMQLNLERCVVRDEQKL